jgi:uncharacterized membrane protein
LLTTDCSTHLLQQLFLSKLFLVVILVVVVVAQLSLISVCIVFSSKIQFDFRLWSVLQKLSERLHHLVNSVFWEVKGSKANL